ncbi:hypothetical protein SLEP1_g16111 [Rubroshorea leprosula]|uniref:Uncharacterized protein n=1 Tax=Rubroshorea leprosula TaxID=152421 RepID=A0AAV5IYK3_9ROSI|nr:hypothetical protein SLEP1_g16111 [Rubroshorea leprosula]
MPTDGTKIPLELDEYGRLPQQIVKDLWNMTAGIKFKHALSELKAKCAKRNFQAKPPDMNPELWAKLVHLWTEDKGHLRRSNFARANRAKGPRVMHTNGSMDVNVYRKKMQQANPEGRPPTYPEVYTSRRQHKGKGKDQLPVYCNDDAQEIGEKLTAEYATRQEEEGFDPTIPHAKILLRATGGVKKGWLKGLDIHTHPQDIGASTSRQEPFRPPIIGQSNRVIELQQTVEALKPTATTIDPCDINVATLPAFRDDPSGYQWNNHP